MPWVLSGKGYILSSTTAGSEDLTSMHSAIWLTRSGLSPLQTRDPMWSMTNTIVYCSWSTPKSHLYHPRLKDQLSGTGPLSRPFDREDATSCPPSCTTCVSQQLTPSSFTCSKLTRKGGHHLSVKAVCDVYD